MSGRGRRASSLDSPTTAAENPADAGSGGVRGSELMISSATGVGGGGRDTGSGSGAGKSASEVLELNRRCFSCCNVLLQVEASVGGEHKTLLQHPTFAQHQLMKDMMGKVSRQEFTDMENFLSNAEKLVMSCVDVEDHDTVLEALHDHVARMSQADANRNATFQGFPYPLIEEMMSHAAAVRKKSSLSGMVDHNIEVGRYLARAYGVGLARGARFCGEENREKEFYLKRKQRELEYKTAVANRAAITAIEAVKRKGEREREVERRKRQKREAPETPTSMPKPIPKRTPKPTPTDTSTDASTPKPTLTPSRPQDSEASAQTSEIATSTVVSELPPPPPQQPPQPQPPCPTEQSGRATRKQSPRTTRRHSIERASSDQNTSLKKGTSLQQDAASGSVNRSSSRISSRGSGSISSSNSVSRISSRSSIVSRTSSSSSSTSSSSSLTVDKSVDNLQASFELDPSAVYRRADVVDGGAAGTRPVVRQRVTKRKLLDCHHLQGCEVELDVLGHGAKGSVGIHGLLQEDMVSCLCGCEGKFSGDHWVEHAGGQIRKKQNGCPFRYLRAVDTKENVERHHKTCTGSDNLCDTCHSYETPGFSMSSCWECHTAMHGAEGCAVRIPLVRVSPSPATSSSGRTEDKSANGEASDSSTTAGSRQSQPNLLAWRGPPGGEGLGGMDGDLIPSTSGGRRRSRLSLRRRDSSNSITNNRNSGKLGVDTALVASAGAVTLATPAAAASTASASASASAAAAAARGAVGSGAAQEEKQKSAWICLVCADVGERASGAAGAAGTAGAGAQTREVEEGAEASAAGAGSSSKPAE